MKKRIVPVVFGILYVSFLAGCGSQDTAQKPVADVMIQQSAKLAEINKMGDEGASKIFGIGDSNLAIAGGVWSSFVSYSSNATDLRYKDSRYPFLRTLNNSFWDGGIPAAESSDVRPLFDAILAKYPHAKIFISIGTNNIFFSDTSTLLDDYKYFISQAKEKGADLRMVSILTRRPDQTIANSDVQYFDQQLQALCQQGGVPYIYANSQFVGNFGLYGPDSDGLHLNSDGDIDWGMVIASSLQ